MIMSKPLWCQDVWRGIWVYLQGPEEVLTVFHTPVHNALALPGNQEVDALA